jgi:hypothetical protein
MANTLYFWDQPIERLTLYDMQGKTVREQGGGNTKLQQLNTSQLSGIDTLKIELENQETLLKKVVSY